ncbi:GerMN domain-containing protein [Paenibacillus sp. M1]|uniref:GerMN domain-containing protein n=1 Tax=Paenibacillus haidiansis TaxID=1574488 RepID=A0ABU7VN04_9BACL
MIKKQLWITGMLVLLLALSTGCGQKPQASSPDEGSVNGNAGNSVSGNQTGSAAGGNNSVSPGVSDPDQAAGEQTEAETETIETYYTDDQMLDLKKSSAEITYEDEAEKYLAALETLKSSGQDDLFALWEKVEFNKAELENGQLTIDITLPDEARLGAGGESLALDALKQTMFQFTEVQSIELLVDGEQVDTLMGHVELEHPMTRN